MSKTLTINIVTKDRKEQFEECIFKLSQLEMVDQVEVHVYDNSTSVETARNNQLVTNRIPHAEYTYCKDFIKCRNLSVTECQTDYFTILDDDDFFVSNALTEMLEDIDIFDGADILSYGCSKLGREDQWSYRCTVICDVNDKFNSLNEFDCYDIDRTSKMYLWNCGKCYRTKFFNDNKIEWRYNQCDDIFPITTAYLLSNSVVMINKPLYIYTVQTGVTRDKTEGELASLEEDMYKSYTDLFNLFNKEYSNKAILYRCLKNSIRQLQVIDNYEPSRLKSLLP